MKAIAVGAGCGRAWHYLPRRTQLTAVSTEFRYGSAEVAQLMPEYDGTPAHAFQKMLEQASGLAPGRSRPDGRGDTSGLFVPAERNSPGAARLASQFGRL